MTGLPFLHLPRAKLLLRQAGAGMLNILLNYLGVVPIKNTPARCCVLKIVGFEEQQQRFTQAVVEQIVVFGAVQP